MGSDEITKHQETPVLRADLVSRMYKEWPHFQYQATYLKIMETRKWHDLQSVVNRLKDKLNSEDPSRIEKSIFIALTLNGCAHMSIPHVAADLKWVIENLDTENH